MNLRPDINVLDWVDIWDTPNVRLPDRSRLYHLAPVGVSTPYVECFTSYLSRLAHAHHVLPSELIQQEIQPHLPSGYRSQGLRGSQIYTCARALNGLGVMAKDWIGALELLTLRSDLSLLTMLPWKGVFPTQGLLRFKRAWCPSCYEQWRANDEIIYEPLLWSINDVTICLNHSRALISDCPRCDRSLPHLDRRYRSGYCSKCNGWLGSPYGTKHKDHMESIGNEFEGHNWIVTNMGDLLAVYPKHSFTPKANRIAEVITALGKRDHEGNIQALARRLDFSPKQFHTWASGKSVPRLRALLHLCYRLNISVVELLTGNGFVNNYRLQEGRYRAWNIKQDIGKRIDKKIFRRKLNSILSSNRYPPPTMKEVSGQFDVSYRRLYFHFPNLCKKISAKHAAYRQECKLRNVNMACEELTEIVLLLHAEGMEPNQGRLARLMSKGAYIREDKVWATYLSLRNELGYDNSKFKKAMKSSTAE